MKYLTIILDVLYFKRIRTINLVSLKDIKMWGYFNCAYGDNQISNNNRGRYKASS